MGTGVALEGGWPNQLFLITLARMNPTAGTIQG